MKVVKNKMAAPFKEVEFDILYGQGISKAGDVLDLASEAGIIDKSGSWFSYKSERIGQGREAAKQYLDEHPDVMAKVESEVLSKHGMKQRAGAPANGKSDEKVEGHAPKGKDRGAAAKAS